MNLIIDVGNTYVKFAVFKDGQLVDKITSKTRRFISGLRTTLKKFDEFERAIISSVGKLPKAKVDTLQRELNVLILDNNTKVPFKNNYATPKTLGVDRIALVSASVQQFPNTNALIIDAGTCITYDFINSKNEYQGGAISPGIRLRYRALNNLTANLPLLETEQPKNLIGDSTANSIHSGVVYGIVNEIDGIVKEYSQKHKDLTVILTGGDAEFLSNQLKSGIFANSNFLLEGLNFILEYNLDE
ncbi:type III pantothenate kinase [Winogradskyella sp. 3972H.M.0a.05]|uniref:type III pantothenate kinase n=1 Tax=Winogradskyella sp. 3972H.M.0a.05 TaxID=2950277 RepID=UPI0033936B59